MERYDEVFKYGPDSPNTPTQNRAQVNALDLMTNWTPPDPGVNERV